MDHWVTNMFFFICFFLEDEHLLVSDVSGTTNIKSSTIYPQRLTLIEGKGVQYCIYILNVFMLVLTG